MGVVVKSYPKNNINNKFYVHEVIKIGTEADTVDINGATRVSDTAVENATNDVQATAPTNLTIPQRESIVKDIIRRNIEKNYTPQDVQRAANGDIIAESGGDTDTAEVQSFKGGEGVQHGGNNGIFVKTDGIRKLLQDFNSARKSFVDYARNNFPTSVVNQNTNREIGISRKGVDKFLSGNITAEKFASGYEIPKLIETAEKVGEATYNKSLENISGYEYYYNTLTIDGKEYAAHIRVRNTNMGDKYYGHTISSVSDIEIEPLARTFDTEYRYTP